MPPLARPQFSVRTKFILLLLLFGLAPAVVLYLMLLGNGTGVRELMLSRLESAARDIGQSISVSLRERIGDVQAFALNAAARDPQAWNASSDPTALREAIDGYVVHYDVYTLSAVVDTTGRVVATNRVDRHGTPLPYIPPTGTSFANALWFQEAVAAIGERGGEVYVSPPTSVPLVHAITGADDPSIVFVTTIRDNAGVAVGYWVNFIDFAVVEDSVTSIVSRLAPDGLAAVRATIVDRDGALVLDWSAGRQSTGFVPMIHIGGAGVAAPLKPDILTTALTGDAGAAILDPGENEPQQAIGYAGHIVAPDIAALDWSVFLTVPVDQALGRWNALLSAMLLALILSTAAIVVAGFVLGTRFTRPIRHLQRVMTNFDGDGASIPYTGRSDEIGAMARALVTFRDAMHRAGETAAERKAKEALERQVAERTAELARAGEFIAERWSWIEGVFGNLPVAVGLIEAPSGHVILANGPLLDLLGDLGGEGSSIDFQCYGSDGTLCPVEERPTARALRGEILRGEEIEIRTDRRQSRFLSVNAAPIRDSNGRITAAVLAFEDVTTKHEASERIRQLALFDPLTNLPNRRALLAELNAALARAAADGTDAALFLVDLDDFKTVNDIRGHRVGDQVLVEVADRLRSAVRATDHVARLGGDEFAIVVTHFATLEELARRADRILGGLRVQFSGPGGTVDIKGSIGIAVSPRGAIQAEELFQMGDLALYAAKAGGGSGKRFFESEMRLKALELSVADVELPRALREGQFEVHYQPIMSLSDMKVASVEALLRWRHPDKGLLTPGAFLHHAIRNHQIVPITFQVVTDSLAQLAAWRRAGLTGFRMAINLSAAAVIDDPLADHVVRRLVTEGLRGSDVILEVTEEAIKEFDRSVAALRRFREMGLGIALDDFGTGHSSLARLREMPIDLIKVDRAFMKPDARTTAILNAMINLSLSLGIPVVVEGVEEAEHVESLKGAAATYAQGYYFARPMTAAEFEEWLRTRGGTDTPARRPRLVS